MGQLIKINFNNLDNKKDKNYKNKLKHHKAMDMLITEFKEYFEPYILDRFIKYQDGRCF